MKDKLLDGLAIVIVSFILILCLTGLVVAAIKTMGSSGLIALGLIITTVFVWMWAIYRLLEKYDE